MVDISIPSRRRYAKSCLFSLVFLFAWTDADAMVNAKFYPTGLSVVGGMLMTFYVGTKVMAWKVLLQVFICCENFYALRTRILIIFGLHPGFFVAYVSH